jgi:type VI secretion system FHA domain protein
VILTLKIVSPGGMRPGESTRQSFSEDGGSIGRAANNSWVLTHNKVSGRHAVISFRNGDFYIQDTSRNGVSINSPDNRLVKERPYALKAHDLIFIEPYEIEVSIEAGSSRVPFEPLDDLFGEGEPFAPARVSEAEPPGVVPAPYGGGEVDPLKFFPGAPAPPAKREPEPVKSADDWLGEHYRPPVAIPDPAMPPPVEAKADPAPIPVGYNPMDESSAGMIVPDLSPMPVEPPRRPKLKESSSRVQPAPPIHVPPPPPRVAAPEAIEPPPQVAPPPPPPPPPPVVPVAAPVQAPIPVPDPGVEVGSRDLANVLAGAGLAGAQVTPELARNLGQILRIVVSGLIDILQSRQRIKEEFRMRQTIFRPADNNPLKFSANVDDALHNLLVKRNAAYLGAVDAFGDAFDDLRDHQLAMLAGMRVAFENMLADFDPDRMQEEFDRQSPKASLQLIPAKLRYWDMFREKRQEMRKDPEATFARLFGEEFARAYEEQFRELRAQRRPRGGDPSKDPKPQP